MQSFPKAAISQLVMYAAIFGVIGLMFGSISWGIVIGLSVWAFFQLKQLARLQAWLHNHDQPVPESDQVWGELFDDLHRLQKRHHKRKSNQG
jgi:two-component system phosphate regulon sensor histidine kinase PhoR